MARNTMANYAGNLFIALVSFLFIPVYIRYLGIGAYGILGFFITLQVFLTFLDLGIGTAINREMSRFYNDPSRVGYLRSLTGSLQTIYWLIGLAIGLLLFVAAPYLSKDWFKSEMPVTTLYTAFIILAITLTLRWPYTLYSSGLRGMQHQVLLNSHDLVWALIKHVGSWLVLKYYSPTLEAFLWYQCIITFLQTVSIAIILWYFMPGKGAASLVMFDKKIVRNIGRFAAGIGAAVLLGNFIMQLDKLIVSKMVKPSQFGYYMVANNVATLVYNASLPIYIATFPHFTKLAYTKDRGLFITDFHFYSKLLNTILLPFSILVFVAAEEILWLWTNNITLASLSAPLLRIMIIGTTLNAAITTVHTLLIAHGRVKVLFYCNLVACLVMVPLTFVLVHYLGVSGGAIALTSIYASNFFIQAMIIFRHTGFQAIALSWYLKDFGQILFPATAVILLAYFGCVSSSNDWSRVQMFLALGIVLMFAYAVAIFFNVELRKKLAMRFFPGTARNNRNI